jgi:hypothetical protein
MSKNKKIVWTRLNYVHITLTELFFLATGSATTLTSPVFAAAGADVTDAGCEGALPDTTAAGFAGAAGAVADAGWEGALLALPASGLLSTAMPAFPRRSRKRVACASKKKKAQRIKKKKLC